MEKATLIGPFKQLITMAGLSLKGPISDRELHILPDAGIIVYGSKITVTGKFTDLLDRHPGIEVHRLEGDHVCIPGLIDAHTHICFAGSRAQDYALRNSGKTYLEIAEAGGGIWDTVTQTRKASMADLVKGIVKRATRHLKNGITTIEVKSGYGLSIEAELKMLYAIQQADVELAVDLIPTCLAAHMLPKDYPGDAEAYLEEISRLLFPLLKAEGLTDRIDAFIEKSAFSKEQIAPYFQKAKEMGFAITVHADQFSTGGSTAAARIGAVSADHLEASTESEIGLLCQSDVIAVALPGASLGLGCNFAPARKILDGGGSLAIASDHNPGSAPMGDLLTQAAILGAFEKLTNAEVLAGITYRAAAALGLGDRGRLQEGYLADFTAFHTQHYNEILYNQGNLKPCMVWKNGRLVFDRHKH